MYNCLLYNAHRAPTPKGQRDLVFALWMSGADQWLEKGNLAESRARVSSTQRRLCREGYHGDD